MPIEPMHSNPARPCLACGLLPLFYTIAHSYKNKQDGSQSVQGCLSSSKMAHKESCVSHIFEKGNHGSYLSQNDKPDQL